jgi:hypothetical protein
LASEVKTQVQGWQTSGVGSPLQIQHPASMARSVPSSTEPPEFNVEVQHPADGRMLQPVF